MPNKTIAVGTGEIYYVLGEVGALAIEVSDNGIHKTIKAVLDIEPSVPPKLLPEVAGDECGPP